MAQVSYKQGDVIFRQGDFGNTMYEVRDGKVGIYLNYGEASEKKLTEVKRSQIFGEMAIIEVYPRSATAVALSDVTAEEVTVADLQSYFERSPEKLIGIMRLQSRRLRELTDDYMAVCATIKEWQDKDDQGGKKSEGLLGSLKKFAAVFAESMKYANTANAGMYLYGPTMMI